MNARWSDGMAASGVCSMWNDIPYKYDVALARGKKQAFFELACMHSSLAY